MPASDKIGILFKHGFLVLILYYKLVAVQQYIYHDTVGDHNACIILRAVPDKKYEGL